jgi:hypothetical protein
MDWKKERVTKTDMIKLSNIKVFFFNLANSSIGRNKVNECLSFSFRFFYINRRLLILAVACSINFLLYPYVYIGVLCHMDSLLLVKKINMSERAYMSLL